MIASIDVLHTVQQYSAQYTHQHIQVSKICKYTCLAIVASLLNITVNMWWMQYSQQDIDT